MARVLFGTDGVRGVAGVDLTAELARGLGAAAARLAGPGAAIVVGRDTRESGPWLEAALVEGIAAGGGRALRAGVLPTPGVAVLARELGAALGCVISASHNPYQDNGIKFLGGDGRKLADDEEERLEELLDASAAETAEGEERVIEGAAERYGDWLVRTYGTGLGAPGPAVVDCANGAAVACAPRVLAACGVTASLIGAEPDGRNINAAVGSTHTGALAAAVEERHAAFGLAFDGDADRCLAVDAGGRVVNGDAIIAAVALARKVRGELAGGGVVVTSMTNLGFLRLMREHGVAVEVTEVGDRYVVERMLATGATLGGEQSGHVVDLERHATGDGIATALMLLAALDTLGIDMAEAAELVEPFPQRLVAVRADRALLASSRPIWQEVETVSRTLGEDGRVVVRASGTEPVVRVMVEAADAGECHRLCERLARVVEREIGA